MSADFGRIWYSYYMTYKLCLFDLDGTLTDPKIGITNSFQYALSSFGIHEKLETLTGFIGPSLRWTFKEYYGFSDSDTEKAVAKYREYFSEKGLYENTVYFGIPEILRSLCDNGVTMAVATNKVTLYSEKILEYFGIRRYFAFVSGDEMDGRLTRNGKSGIIRIALNALDRDRQMPAVMIGDRVIDITGARDNEIDSIWADWGYGTREERDSSGATWIADSPDELRRLIL